MITDIELWDKLEDPEYRKRFVEELTIRAFALQIRTIRKLRRWSQGELAKEAGITQGVVSRTENPNLGTTFATASQVAAGFGLAFIAKIVPYSEFVCWVKEMSEGFNDLPTFDQEDAARKAAMQQVYQFPNRDLNTSLSQDAARELAAVPSRKPVSSVESLTANANQLSPGLNLAARS